MAGSKRKKPVSSNLHFRGYIRTLLALRLRMIEHEFETFDDFVKATGLPGSAVFKLLRGMQNVTSDTMDTLARNLRISVFELLNAPAYIRNDSLIQNTAVDHHDIYNALVHGRKLDLNELRGGKRKDWRTLAAKRRRKVVQLDENGKPIKRKRKPSGARASRA